MLCSFIRSTIAEFFVYEISDLISLGVIGSPALPVNAAETPLIKTEVFRSDTADFSYDFKDEIEENGQRYKLGNVEYTVLSEKEETEIRHEVTTETVDNLYGLITVTCDVLAAVKVTENKAVVGELRVNFRPYLGTLYHILVFNNVLAVDDQIQVERRTCVVLGISGLCYGLCRVVCAVLFSKNVTSVRIAAACAVSVRQVKDGIEGKRKIPEARHFSEHVLCHAHHQVFFLFQQG